LQTGVEKERKVKSYRSEQREWLSLEKNKDPNGRKGKGGGKKGASRISWGVGPRKVQKSRLGVRKDWGGGKRKKGVGQPMCQKEKGQST